MRPSRDLGASKEFKARDLSKSLDASRELRPRDLSRSLDASRELRVRDLTRSLDWAVCVYGGGEGELQQHLAHTKKKCGYIFKTGDIAWLCRTCQADDTCVDIPITPSPRA